MLDFGVNITKVVELAGRMNKLGIYETNIKESSSAPEARAARTSIRPPPAFI